MYCFIIVIFYRLCPISTISVCFCYLLSSLNSFLPFLWVNPWIQMPYLAILHNCFHSIFSILGFQPLLLNWNIVLQTFLNQNVVLYFPCRMVYDKTYLWRLFWIWTLISSVLSFLIYTFQNLLCCNCNTIRSDIKESKVKLLIKTYKFHSDITTVS